MGEIFPPTRLTLLARAATNDNDSWEEFYSFYYKVIRARCAKHHSILDEKSIRQIVQEVMVALNSGGALKRYDVQFRKFHSYLAGIVDNKVKEWRRGGRKAKESLVSDPEKPFINARSSRSRREARAFEDPLAFDMPKDEMVERLAMGELVARLFCRLRGDSSVNLEHVRVFELLMDGHKPEAVAAEMGLETNYVYQIKRRISLKLKEYYSQEAC